MVRIKPVSDLRNYNEVLSAFLMIRRFILQKNGRGAYAVLTISDYDKLTAKIKFLSEMKKGEDSAVKSGWIKSEDVRKILEV